MPRLIRLVRHPSRSALLAFSAGEHADCQTYPRSRVVGFGSRATNRRAAVMSDVTIVGEDEADPPTGLIAWTAPLARALEGAEALSRAMSLSSRRVGACNQSP
jgi:hypothetical protein